MTTGVLTACDSEDENSATELVESVHAFTASFDVSKHRFCFVPVRAPHSAQIGNTENANHVPFSHRDAIDVFNARRLAHHGN